MNNKHNCNFERLIEQSTQNVAW